MLIIYIVTLYFINVFMEINNIIVQVQEIIIDLKEMKYAAI